jgi:hydrogenase maturation factor
MCRSTVGRVRSVSDGWAVVEIDGVVRRASAVLIPDLRRGDRVLIGLGTVLGRVDDADAAALQALERGLGTTASLPAGPSQRRS